MSLQNLFARSTMLLLCLIAVRLLGIPSPRLQAATIWSTIQGDASHTAYVPGVLDPSEFHLLWSLRHTGFTDTDTLRPVAAGDGKVFLVKRTYVSTDSEVWARDARTGALLWHRSIPNQQDESAAAYADGKVYVHAAGHSSGPAPPTVYCFDAATGFTVWATGHAGQWSGVSHGPAAARLKVHAHDAS